MNLVKSGRTWPIIKLAYTEIIEEQPYLDFIQ